MSSGMPTAGLSPFGLWGRFATARGVVAAILLLAIALRLGVMLAFPITPRTDSLWYLERGREMAAGMGYQEGGFATAFWPVGYPALLAVATGMFGQSLLGPLLFNLIAQAATILLILWLARCLGAGEGAARVAAFLYALYPAHIAYTGDTAAETTATAVMLAGIALVLKARAVTGRGRIVLLMLVYAGMAMAVAPWTLRNRTVLGAPVLVSTNGGVALQAGANDLADGGYFQVERSPLWAQVGIPFADRVQRQVEIDRRLKAMATDWIAAHPVRWGTLGLRKMALVWMKDGDGFWSLDASHPEHAMLWKLGQALNQLFYMAMLALAAVGTVLAARAAWARRAGAAMLVPVVLPVFCTVLAFGFTGQTRYHYPAMPFVFILSAWTIGRWVERRREPSRAPAAMSGHDG